ncbi:hypothetical protein IB691_09825 [Fangia hongkongensis]|nr:hypothetical protein [Fangia hongkongensis]
MVCEIIKYYEGGITHTDIKSMTLSSMLKYYRFAIKKSKQEEQEIKKASRG